MLDSKLISDISVREIFRHKLFLSGYVNCIEYGQVFFRYLEKITYSVNDSFPKITSKNISPQIVYVKYGLSLSAIEEFRKE